jgi:hypothetical protein
MIRKNMAPGTLLLCLMLSALPVCAQEKTIELGKDARWAELLNQDRVIKTPGRWGFSDLALPMAEYVPDGSTEMLFHFNLAVEADAAGHYGFPKAPAISEAVFALGGGSAVFQGDQNGLLVTYPSASLFSPGATWQDFSLEFWLSPSDLLSGQSAISWEGAVKNAAGVAQQSMRASFQDRRIVWEFTNLFTLPGGQPLSFSLSGTRRLLPRAWHQHLLRFDSTLGLLEYLIDGTPEAVTHVTDTGHEGGTIAIPRLSTGTPGQLVLGEGLTGYIDELRVSRRFIESPSVKKYEGRTGMATTKIMDLGYTSTRVVRIDSVYTTPADSGVSFSYKVTDVWTNPRNATPGDWTPFIPGTDFKDSVHGRYIQVMMELYPDGAGSQSPRVSSLTVVYEPNLPPTPPAAVASQPGNGRVVLTWRKVNDLNVKGYRVYYGDSPHMFLGTGAAQGESPIDVGDVTRAEIAGLENGKLYYFAVVSYDGSQPPQQSAFSTEVSARPSRVYP